jgi:ribosomal protein S18 acetylase RimI-like enzyme
VYARVALDGDRIVGIVHYVFHRSTWMIEETCYLQDLFVQPAYRGRGIARTLIEAVYQEADRRGGRQVYWITHTNNAAARGLYDKVAINAGFIVYERIAETHSVT